METMHLVRKQGQFYKGKGTGSGLEYDGAYTTETFTFANVAAGTTDLVAATTGKKIRVLSYSLSCGSGGAATVIFKSSTAGAISHTISLAANGNFSESDASGLFETTAGEKLQATVTTTTTGVRVTYILVD